MSTLTTTITPTTMPARRSPVVRETAPNSISTTTNGFRRFRSSIRYHAGGFSVATSFRPNFARRGSTSDAGSPLSCASRRRSNAGTVASDASRRSGEAAPGIRRAGSRRLRDFDDFWTRVRSPVGIVLLETMGRTPSPRATEARRRADERPRATPGRACRCCAAPGYRRPARGRGRAITQKSRGVRANEMPRAPAERRTARAGAGVDGVSASEPPAVRPTWVTAYAATTAINATVQGHLREPPSVKDCDEHHFLFWTRQRSVSTQTPPGRYRTAHVSLPASSFATSLTHVLTLTQCSLSSRCSGFVSHVASCTTMLPWSSLPNAAQIHRRWCSHAFTSCVSTT